MTNLTQPQNQKSTVQSNEIFRHLRPQWFDAKTFNITPQKSGGISFLLKPLENGTYNYWLYICPLDAPFSTKVAVHNLRERAARSIEPWGRITLTDEPILIQLVKSVMSEEYLVSDASKMAFEIIMTVWSSEAKKEKALSDPAAISIYKNL